MKCWTISKINVFGRFEVLSFCSKCSSWNPGPCARLSKHSPPVHRLSTIQENWRQKISNASLTNIHTTPPPKTSCNTREKTALAEWRGTEMTTQQRGVLYNERTWCQELIKPRREENHPGSKFSFICIDLKLLPHWKSGSLYRWRVSGWPPWAEGILSEIEARGNPNPRISTFHWGLVFLLADSKEAGVLWQCVCVCVPIFPHLHLYVVCLYVEKRLWGGQSILADTEPHLFISHSIWFNWNQKSQPQPQTQTISLPTGAALSSPLFTPRPHTKTNWSKLWFFFFF